jgi:succinoglycan biosynthesis protein ExoA
MSEFPLVTIAIPCLNERSHIERCVRAALGQDYPADRLEVIVADGGSTDGTRRVLAELAREDPRMRWIDNPGRIQARGLNQILRLATGCAIVRLDAHCEYAPDYVRRCVETLRRTGADNVGGAQRIRASTPFHHAVSAALESPLGMGGADYRSPDREGFVDTVFCGAFPRAVFERVGLYDPGAITNEDAELNLRIAAAGGRIFLSRQIVAHYTPRGSYRALARQYFRYGQGRARTLLKLRRLPRLRAIGPFLAVLAGVTLLAWAPRSPLTWAAFGTYAVVAAVEALRAARRHPGASAPAVWAVFPVLHVSHGCGMVAGFVRYALRPDWGPPERLAPRLDAVDA